VDEKAAETTSTENRRFDDSLRGSVQSGELLSANSELISSAFQLNALTRELFLAGNISEIDAVTAGIRQKFDSIDALQKRIIELLSAMKRSEEISLMKGAAGSLKEINSAVFAKDGVVSMLRDVIRVKEKAVALNGDLREFIGRERGEGEKGVSSAHEEQGKTISTVNRVMNLSIVVIGIISVSAVVLVFSFGFWIFRSVSKPLYAVVGVADKISRGDLTTELAGGNDEFGELSENMNNMVRSFREIIGKIIVSADKTRQALDRLTAEAEQSADGANRQADQAQQIAVAAEELSQTINDVARNASSASAASNAAISTANEGKNLSDGAVETVGGVYVSTEELAAMIKSLSGKVAEIGDVVTVIKEIADQTNLLALNAAIEAAHAGDMGRGFAVVADEVRKLAERTIEATGEIAEKISAVQTESEKTSMSMSVASHEVTRATEYIRNMGEALNQIVSAAHDASDQTARIAVSVEQQSSTSRDVAMNSEKTAQIASAQRASAETVMKEIAGLVNAAEELRSATLGFRL
jgi:methyl-accepting chemotaxis protein